MYLLYDRLFSSSHLAILVQMCVDKNLVGKMALLPHLDHIELGDAVLLHTHGHGDAVLLYKHGERGVREKIDKGKEEGGTEGREGERGQERLRGLLYVTCRITR